MSDTQNLMRDFQTPCLICVPPPDVAGNVSRFFDTEVDTEVGTEVDALCCCSWYVVVTHLFISAEQKEKRRLVQIYNALNIHLNYSVKT